MHTFKQKKNKEDTDGVHEKNPSNFYVNEAKLYSVVQASITRHEGESVILVHLLRKENEWLVAKVNLNRGKSCARKLHF